MVEIYGAVLEGLSRAERSVDRAASRIAAQTAGDTASHGVNRSPEPTALAGGATPSYYSSEIVSLLEDGAVYRTNLKVRAVTNDTVRRLLDLIV